MIGTPVRRWCRVLLCSATLLACARPAAAEWQFAPFFGWEFGGHTSLLDSEAATDDRHRALGVTVTRLFRGPFGFEGTALLVPGFFNDPKKPALADTVAGSHTYAVMGNFVVVAPQRWNEYGLRPYVSGGVGLLHAGQDLVGPDAEILLTINRSLFGANVGGGAVGFFSDHTGVRFDLRFFTNVRNLTSDESGTVNTLRTHLRYWALTIGLVLR